LSATGSEAEKITRTDGFRGQVTLKRLVDRDTIDISIIDEPDDLVREQLRVVLLFQLADSLISTKRNTTNLTIEVRLRRLGRVQLKTLTNALTKHVTRGVGFHNLCHCLLNEGLHTREPVAICRPQVVRQVHTNHDTSRRWVDTHRVGHVVEELCTSVTLDIMRVEVTPTQLNVDPVFVTCRPIHDIFVLQTPSAIRTRKVN
jgi:hypothetical protein